MEKLSLIDALFLLSESRRMPMHVGGLFLCTLPRGVNAAEFFEQVSPAMEDGSDLRHPFSDKLKLSAFNTLASMRWEHDDDIDMEYHIRHSALPKPGRYRELFALISRLHTSLLDRSRPLWEFHLIEGLQKRQVALYFKAHHCSVDGVGGQHINRILFSTDPDHRIDVSPFSRQAAQSYANQLGKSEPRKIAASDKEVVAVMEVVKQQFGSTANVARALKTYTETWLGRNRSLAVPVYQVPKTKLNTQITGARRFVAQSWSLERIKAIGKAFNGTVNDALLAICSGALRRYLIEQHDLPRYSLKAMTPVSLRGMHETASGNAVSFVTADLATNVRDPEKRVRQIQESMLAAKAQFKGMSRREIEIYTALTQAPTLFVKMTGLDRRFPMFSTVISNVPGMAEQRYLNGACLDGSYPVSIPADGLAINITVISNNNNLDFGIVACRRSVPKLQRIIDYMDESIIELEDVFDLKTKKSKRAPVRKAKPATKRGSKSQSTRT